VDSKLSSRLRIGRIGFQYEQICRVICYLLSGWYGYAPEREKQRQKRESRRNVAAKPIHLTPEGKLTAIQFDKFVMLAARVWDEVFANTGKLLLDRIDIAVDKEIDDAVTFPCPFIELPGKHGPGRAIRRPKGRAEFVISVLLKLQQEELLPYFDVVLPKTNSAGATDPRTTVEPAVPLAMSDEFIADFTAREKRVLFELNHAIRTLSASGIRALGTHTTLRKTEEDIQREFDWVKRQVDLIIDALESSEPFDAPAQEMVEFADEACRKSFRNRYDYRDGLNRLHAELTDPELKTAVRNCHAAPEDIWDAAAIKRQSTRATRMSALAQYVRSVATIVTQSDRPVAPKEKERFAGASTELRKQGISTLPDAPDDLLDSSSRMLRADVRSQLCHELKSN